LNKSDLVESNKTEDLLDFTSSKYHEKVIGTYLTSAKTGLQVDEIFQKLAYQMLKPE
jgi:hypothetical protein